MDDQQGPGMGVADPMDAVAPVTRSKHRLEGKLKKMLTKEADDAKSAVKEQKSRKRKITTESERETKRIRRQATASATKQHAATMKTVEDIQKQKLIRKIKVQDPTAKIDAKMPIEVLMWKLRESKKDQWRGTLIWMANSAMLSVASLAEYIVPKVTAIFGKGVNLKGLSGEVAGMQSVYSKLFDDLVDDMNVPELSPIEMIAGLFAFQVATTAMANTANPIIVAVKESVNPPSSVTIEEEQK